MLRSASMDIWCRNVDVKSDFSYWIRFVRLSVGLYKNKFLAFVTLHRLLFKTMT